MPGPDLTGRTALVTGASDGIGKEVARGLAGMGARVVLACRNAEKGEAARAEIAASSGNPDVHLQLVDFSVQASVRAFADKVVAAHPRLDVLVNNAGLWSDERRLTPDGHELTWAVNALGYFLTTGLLLGLLRAAETGRIVNVASELAGDLDLSDLSFERRRWGGVTAYSQSKQANRMWTWALARRLGPTQVTANAMHPGGVSTGIFRKGGGLRGWAAGAVTSVVGRTPAQGADTVLWLASSPEIASVSGRFFVDRKERACRFRDEAAEERLWSVCEAMTGCRY